MIINMSSIINARRRRKNEFPLAAVPQRSASLAPSAEEVFATKLRTSAARELVQALKVDRPEHASILELVYGFDGAAHSIAEVASITALAVYEVEDMTSEALEMLHYYAVHRADREMLQAAA